MTINFVVSLDPALKAFLETFLNAFVSKQNSINTKLDTVMNNLTDILTDVQAEPTIIGSLGVMMQGLKDQLAAALAGTTIPPAVQTQIDAVFAAAEANKAALAQALLIGTPVVVAPGNVPATPTVAVAAAGATPAG